jgi:hypothetical protein
MNTGAAPTSPSGTTASAAAELWDKTLKAELRNSPHFTDKFYERLRAAKLTFGNRVHCPFLRPFFLSPEDEQRVRVVAETMADLGERVANAALGDPLLLGQFHLREQELRLVRLGKTAGPASTASRLDAFLLPDSLKFAEYNGESPAGAGYTETLAEIFRELPVMKGFEAAYQIHSYPLSAEKCRTGTNLKSLRRNSKRWVSRWNWPIRGICISTVSNSRQAARKLTWFTGVC